MIDASGTWDKTTQHAAKLRISRTSVKVSTRAWVPAESMHAWRSPKGHELGKLIGDHLSSYGWVVNSFSREKR